MAAGALKCPMCGASASTDATKCQHCGARLATVACPSCFGMIFKGAKFCSHCGERADRADTIAEAFRCPRCAVGMKFVKVGRVGLQECSRCEGIWADAASLQEIYNDREKQAVVLGTAALVLDTEQRKPEKIRYLPCPACKELMHRVNFANCSAVIVDVCRNHGTWFDKNELRRIVEFIRSGGLEKARRQQIRDLQEERRRLDAAKVPAIGTALYEWERPSYDWSPAISAAARFLISLLRR